MTDWVFPAGILGVDLPGCDCEQCMTAVEMQAAAVPVTQEVVTRALGHRKVWSTIEHFGEQMRSGKYGYRLTRDQYALPNKTRSGRADRDLFTARQWAEEAWAFEDENHTILSESFCVLQRKYALENFDLNMAFFSRIRQSDFEDALTEMLRKNKRLKPITDLRTLDGDEGVYVMVLDDYRQAYIGQSRDIRARIKRHWSGTKPFDRLLWGDPHESVLSIDSFRSSDTTRIFAARTARGDRLEAKLVRTFPDDYTVNRIAGGKPDRLRLVSLEAEIKRRQLVPQVGSPPLA